MDAAPSAKSRDPLHSEIHAEQGKPVVPPETASEPRGTLLVLRVKDGEESECRSVMERIGIATLSHAKAGRLSLGVSSQESGQNLLNGRKANGRRNIGCVRFLA
jgi:hypothetical protein